MAQLSMTYHSLREFKVPQGEGWNSVSGKPCESPCYIQYAA
jgi:hypothetical protein